MTRLPRSYPAALLIAIIAVMPVGVLLILAQLPDDLFDTRHLSLLLNTVWLTVLTVLGAILLGVPLALLTA